MDASDPHRWAQAHIDAGYRAAYCPLASDASDEEVQAVRRAATEADIIIAEVGAWSNLISPDDSVRKEAILYCKAQLYLADRIGARCCVNIAGSRGSTWDGPHPENLSEDTFALIVETVRDVIDEVEPQSASFALETMPWAIPDSAESYVRLIHAIDRVRFGAHLDPVNLINSPQRLYRNTDVIRECFRMLSPYIVSTHAKDISLGSRLTVHLDEVIPGRGSLDYVTFLRELNTLHPDIPVMLEHLGHPEEYEEAAGYIRTTAANIGTAL